MHGCVWISNPFQNCGTICTKQTNILQGDQWTIAQAEWLEGMAYPCHNKLKWCRDMIDHQ